MSSLALMRWLEAAPRRYDAGMRALTLGRIEPLHAAIAEAATPSAGARVLEIGCGTGAVTERLVARGARVTALDQNPEMLEQARARLGDVAAVTWLECTAAEIDTLPTAGFDAVVASLCLSEMSTAERAFVLREAVQRLGAGGQLVLGDEVVPRPALLRWLHAVLRIPQRALAWLLAGSPSRPLRDLENELLHAGFELRSQRRWLGGSLALVVAAPRKGPDA